MARVVQLKDQTPLLVKAADLTNGVCAVCRCGLSGKWPLCDGTHKATSGEEPGKVYHYDRTLPQGVPQRHEVDPGILDGSTDTGGNGAPGHARPGRDRPARPPAKMQELDHEHTSAEECLTCRSAKAPDGQRQPSQGI